MLLIIGVTRGVKTAVEGPAAYAAVQCVRLLLGGYSIRSLAMTVSLAHLLSKVLIEISLYIVTA